MEEPQGHVGHYVSRTWYSGAFDEVQGQSVTRRGAYTHMGGVVIQVDLNLFCANWPIGKR